MTSPGLSLSDFLLARIAEDEAVACIAIGKDWEAVTDDHGRKGIDHSVWTGTVVDGRYVAEVVLSASSAEHIARHDPARVAAECNAKRWIVARYEDEPWQYILRALALPHADHPDYREEWRP